VKSDVQNIKIMFFYPQVQLTGKFIKSFLSSGSRSSLIKYWFEEIIKVI